MAITVGAGFRLRSPQQNFERDSYKTLEEMNIQIDIDTTEVDCIHSIDAKEVPFLNIFLKAIQNDDVEKVTEQKMAKYQAFLGGMGGMF